MTTPTPPHDGQHEIPLDDTAVLPILPTSPTSTKRKALPLLIACAALLGLCCGGAAIIAANNSDSAQPSASNTTPGNRFLAVDASPTPPTAEPTTADPGTGGDTAKPKTAAPRLSAKPTVTRTTSPRPAPTTTQPKPPPVTDPRFRNCKEANAAGYGPYRRGIDPEYAWYRDPNGDGLVCERR
ncbi:excalibur calcium-binding domain-containing protein [Micromonospora sp. CB01531]|uniref:excalibur calcium-binding domain-containing protein n=1 Tax=Micromonospora sp. CB01531 TaxID=1718947 RepID=UPI0009F8DF46|nr:excalibur calcium-binding domain-containing protein [Micromonospora sp. CB01531]